MSDSSSSSLRPEGLLEIPPWHRHDPLEALIGVPFGIDRTSAPLPAGGGETPRAALEAAILPQLRRAPCLVTFSGGRDSSTILAIAANLAERHGLPNPIAVTNVFPESPASDEGDWQRAVIEHLPPLEWRRLRWTDELDLLGPYAQRVLERHGAVFPSNAHFLGPFLELAAGGSLLTGLGGDEVLGPHARSLAASLLYEQRRPRHGELRSTLAQLAPLPLRSRRDARRSPLHRFHWIRPATRTRLAHRYTRTLAATPLAWDRSLDWLWRSRYTQCLRSTLRALGSAHDVNVAAPFLDPGVLRAIADASGHRAAPPRAVALADLVGNLLPDAVLSRTTKAGFDDPYWNRHTRAFVGRWRGNGVDTSLVDGAELAREWRSPRPIAASSTLLQRAWLAESGESVDGVGLESTREDGRNRIHGLEAAGADQPPGR